MPATYKPAAIDNDADFAALRLQVHEGVHRGVERGGIEAAKPFVDEKRFDAKAVGGERREAERQGEGYEEGLAPGEGVNGAALVCHIPIPHDEIE